MQLDPKLTNGYQEGVDWVGLSRLGYFSNAVLAVTANTDHLSYWVVKKVCKLLNTMFLKYDYCFILLNTLM